MWDLRASSRDWQVKAANGAVRTGEALVSIGLLALWVGWPGGLALYACGRAARVMRRDDLALFLVTRGPEMRSRDRS
jgi:hypothetical protein